MKAAPKANGMNYHPIMAEAEALSVADMTEFLRGELPRRWIADYKAATPRPTNILSVELGSFVYLFDFVTELELEGILEPGTVREDRLVGGHGLSTAEAGGREAGRMRGWVGPTEKYLGRGRDKGHVFGRALGGRVDGLEINLFSQARALNRGWSEEGKLFRKMEQHCATHPGTFCYFRPRYKDHLACPASVEFGVLLAERKLWVEEFQN
jgi:hypothetical protein